MYKKMLFATDLSKSQHEMCAKAYAYAEKFDSQLFLLHVIQTPSSAHYAAALGFAELLTPPLDEARLVLQTLANEFSIPQEQQIIQAGIIKKTIPEVAKNLAIDLIFLGNHYHDDSPHLFSTITQQVIHEATCDVTILS